ncbi:iron(III) transport system ATP-binding protein [Haloferula luteola]|uniref:Iron(III) transport system ATP-binding protein n=1 Tax=Haloferula luteola TaxID=595692 RepID=A0A840V832_9BACT|nr:ABC transporter ATP-binding protein [Haloferula luteola]MBB5349929.1 iron(III) transport system ATP-binding protein [Haloferula luteola]
MESIRADKIVKQFGPVTALDGVSLEIGAGELFFLLGSSGCGKTTLLRSIAGLETPTSGSIHFGEKNVTQLPPHKREAAMVFQSYALWPHLTVGRNVAFGLEERKVAKKEIDERVKQALELVHLGAMVDRGVDQLSGGQQQRVALARALVVRPRCLLLDEPLSNLDAKLRIEMRREIRRIVKEGGLTAIYVTHDQEEALEMADRMAVLNQGRIEQLGTPEEVYRSPRTPFVAGFIGETNLLEGEVLDVRDGFARVQTAAGEVVGRLSGWDEGDGPPSGGAKVVLSVRPEAWALDAPGESSVTGRVVDRSYLGRMIRYTMETAAGRQQVVELNPETLRTPAEATVKLSARPADVVVMKP